MQQKAAAYITLAAASDLLFSPTIPAGQRMAETEALAETHHLDTFTDDDGSVYVSRVSVHHYAAAQFRTQLEKEPIR